MSAVKEPKFFLADGDAPQSPPAPATSAPAGPTWWIRRRYEALFSYPPGTARLRRGVVAVLPVEPRAPPPGSRRSSPTRAWWRCCASRPCAPIPIGPTCANRAARSSTSPRPWRRRRSGADSTGSRSGSTATLGLYGRQLARAVLRLPPCPGQGPAGRGPRGRTPTARWPRCSPSSASSPWAAPLDDERLNQTMYKPVDRHEPGRSRRCSSRASGPALVRAPCAGASPGRRCAGDCAPRPRRDPTGPAAPRVRRGVHRGPARPRGPRRRRHAWDAADHADT